MGSELRHPLSYMSRADYLEAVRDGADVVSIGAKAGEDLI
mgnify:CR=1 FL=1|jgi:hypothetical protein